MNSHLTFEQLRSGAVLPPTNAPIRVAARQMRWLRSAFAKHVTQMSEELGCEFHIDTTKLGVAFVRWLRALENARPVGHLDRRDFFDFAASLMMQELVAAMPITAKGPATAVTEESSAAFWPEGYVCTLFCLSVHAAVFRQEYDDQPPLSPKVEQTDFWWTYKENCIEDYRLASGFFQTILGYRPDWNAPNQYKNLRVNERSKASEVIPAPRG